MAFLGAPKKGVAAVGAGIAFGFCCGPFLVAQFPSLRDRPEDDFLADRHRKVIDLVTREIIALVTAVDFEIFAAVFNRAGATVQKEFVDIPAEAANAVHVFDAGAVDGAQSLFEFCIFFSLGKQ